MFASAQGMTRDGGPPFSGNGARYFSGEVQVTAVNTVTDYTVEGAVGVVTLNSPPVNALSAKVREGILEGIRIAVADPATKAIVLICEGRTFIAGADITEFSSGPPPKGGFGQAQNAIEFSPKPVVAAIHGTALGGGLEVALLCHYRVAVPSARCGVPEVNIGLLPGGGGTQRLPRAVGVEAALEMVTSGRHAPAPECLKLGLIDQLIPEGQLREGAIAFARKLVAEGRPARKLRDEAGKLQAARNNPEIFEKVRKANAEKRRGFLAPEHNIKAVEAAVNLPFDEGIKEERRLFDELMSGGQAPAQQYYFFAERQAAKIPDAPGDTPLPPIDSIGVAGAGAMGRAIAMAFASAGFPITLVAGEQETLDRGLAAIRGRYEQAAAHGDLTAAQVAEQIGLINGSLDISALAHADLVVADVSEPTDLFGRLDAICRPGAILAAGGSSLDIDELASRTKRPEAVIGLQFLPPTRLVEVVRGAATSKVVINTAMKLAKKIGKIAVLVGAGPGLVGERMRARQQREAQALLSEGVLPRDVDRVLYDFGFPMAFAMSGLAGLGAGSVNAAAKSGGAPRQVSDEEILQRTIYAIINEGAKILEEGKAIRPSDIDVIWVNGHGWPVYRGGPMYYADQIGLDKVLAKLKEFQAKYGEDWKPSALLENLAAQSEGFRSLR